MRSRYPDDGGGDGDDPGRAVAPHGPGDLIARATEMLASFDGDKVSPDAHAERCLDECEEASDATFIRQCFYGRVRYAKMLGAFTKTMYHARWRHLTQRQRLYTVYAYLLLRLDELGWISSRDCWAPTRSEMLPLMKFAFDERVGRPDEGPVAEDNDLPWVDNVLESCCRGGTRRRTPSFDTRTRCLCQVGRRGPRATRAVDDDGRHRKRAGDGRKGPRLNGVTVPKPFKLHPLKPKLLPAGINPEKPKPNPCRRRTSCGKSASSPPSNGRFEGRRKRNGTGEAKAGGGEQDGVQPLRWSD